MFAVLTHHGRHDRHRARHANARVRWRPDRRGLATTLITMVLTGLLVLCLRLGMWFIT